MPARCRGSLTVEAAIVFPLTIMMMLGLLQFGLTVAAKITTLAAAHAAARSACVYPGPRKPATAAGYILRKLRPLEGQNGTPAFLTSPTSVTTTDSALLIRVDCRYNLIYPLTASWLGSSSRSLRISSTFYIHDEIP